MYELKYGSQGPLVIDVEHVADPANPAVYTPLDLADYHHLGVVVVPNRGEGTATEYSSATPAHGVAIDGSVINRINWTVPAAAYGSVLKRTGTVPYLIYVRLYVDASRWFAVPEGAGEELHIRPSG